MKGINLKSEKGEAVIEATLIYPIVFFVVGFIILFGLYEMQGVLEYSCAQYIANYTSKLVTEPGYENYGEINNNDIDFKSVNDFNDEDDKFHADIYRRINFNGISQSEMESKLKGMVNSGRLLKINTTDCSVKFKRTILNTTIIVTVKDTITMPKFLNYIGLDNKWERSITATSVITDPAEFIRNFDMAQDAITYVLDKLGLGDKIEPLLEKVTGFYNKYIKP
ncbi:MAG: hypothetical protein K1W24_00425 [Lachnospiraceae bacterium]